MENKGDYIQTGPGVISPEFQTGAESPGQPIEKKSPLLTASGVFLSVTAAVLAYGSGLTPDRRSGTTIHIPGANLVLVLMAFALLIYIKWSFKL